MITFALTEIAHLLNIPAPIQDTVFTGISSDTRTLFPGNLYIALRGERFDGHDFIEESIKKGAKAILVDHPISFSIPHLIVKDTLLAFGKISEAWRDQFNIPFIGVTGSNGKTTLKNMIATILRAACANPTEVLATEGNLNNNIGVPIMLSRLNAQHRFAVIEMGMNHFGEIAYLTQLVKPRVAVVNNAAKAHLEGLKDVAGVARAKGEIFLGLEKNGTAILNRDDAHFDYWRGLISQNNAILSFGFSTSADITAVLLENSHFIVKTPKGEIEINLPLLGVHNIMNALAATAATIALDVDLSVIKKGLENVHPAPGRMQQYLLNTGTRVIDDTYNANPSSLHAAITTLANVSGTKILILGDMKELGEDAKQHHFDAGIHMQKAGIEYVFTFGELSALTSQAFGQNACHFTEREKLIAAIQSYLQNDVTILIKGSRSMQMEKIVAGIVPKNQLEHLH